MTSFHTIFVIPRPSPRSRATPNIISQALVAKASIDELKGLDGGAESSGQTRRHRREQASARHSDLEDGQEPYRSRGTTIVPT